QAFAGKPPASLKEVAERYGALFRDEGATNDERPTTNDQRRTTDDKGTAAAANAGVAGADSALRTPHSDLLGVVTGANGPLMVGPAEVERLLDRAQRNALQALQRKVDQVKASPDAPAHAMVLEDAATPVRPHILMRGNPNNPGAEVPRQFLLALA